MNNTDDMTNVLKTIEEEKFILGDDILFDSILSELSQNGNSIKLAYTESKTLLLLINHSGEIVPREQITDFVWQGRIVTDSSLAKSISNIRKALREFGLEDESIITVPRMGYRLTCATKKIIEELQPTSSDEISDPESLIQEEYGAIHKSSGHSQSSPINRWTIKQLNNIPQKIKILIIIANICMLSYAGYNVSWRIDQDLNKTFLAKGYEITTQKIQNKSYQVIKPDTLVMTSTIRSLISLAPDGSLVFIKKTDSVYNISYQINEKGFSFTFQDKNMNMATCKIMDVLYDGEKKCGT